MTREEAKTILRETSVTPDIHPDSIGKYFDAIMMAIEALEQQPKTGHWVVLTMCANEGTYCSECSTKVFDFVHPPKKKLSQYCPHCGVKMDEKYDPWEN